MKKIISVILAMVLCLSLAACGSAVQDKVDQVASAAGAVSDAAEKIAEAVSAVNNAVDAVKGVFVEEDGDIVISKNDVLDDIELDSSYEQVEPTEADIESCQSGTITAKYSDGNKQVDFLVGTIENTDGKTLEEVVEKAADSVDGCYDIFEDDGNKLGQYTFLNEKDGEIFFEKVYVYEADGGFNFVICDYYTKEVQIGTSNVYFYLPVVYQEIELQDDDTADDMVVHYNPGQWDLADMCVYQWKETGVKDVQGYIDLLKKEYGSAVVETLKIETSELSVGGVEISTTLDDVDYTEVSIFYVADDGLITEFWISAPTEQWPSMGEAVARSIHLK